jgi:hypothetical protein
MSLAACGNEVDEGAVGTGGEVGSRIPHIADICRLSFSEGYPFRAGNVLASSVPASEDIDGFGAFSEAWSFAGR